MVTDFDSIAISLKRIVEMMEDDRRPQLTMLPEGYESDPDRRHREWCEKIDRAQEIDLRRTVALETIAKRLVETPAPLSHTGSDRG